MHKLFNGFYEGKELLKHFKKEFRCKNLFCWKIYSVLFSAIDTMLSKQSDGSVIYKNFTLTNFGSVSLNNFHVVSLITHKNLSLMLYDFLLKNGRNITFVHYFSNTSSLHYERHNFAENSTLTTLASFQVKLKMLQNRNKNFPRSAQITPPIVQ